MGVHVHKVDPYRLKESMETLTAAVREDGVSLVVMTKPCYLRGSKAEEQFFKPKKVAVDPERCNGCMICINDFGCPALVYNAETERVAIDAMSCVQCGLCAEVCKRGAIA